MLVQYREALEKEKIFKELEREFESTFRELIPGIVHGFANPLNGILGRSELLGVRVERIFEPIVHNGDTIDSDIRDGCKKIIDDVELLTRETNRLFDLFNNVAGKFGSMQDTSLQKINLSELLEEEVAFLQFYPDSRHGITKKLILDREIPEVEGVKAHYSTSLLAIMRHAVYSMKDSESKELVVTTGHDNSHVSVTIKDTGTPITDLQRQAMEESGNLEHHSLHDHDEWRPLLCALSLLNKYDALFQTANESGYNMISIRIPYAATSEV